MRIGRPLVAAVAAALLVTLAGCAEQGTPAAQTTASTASGSFPITIKSAFGFTTIESQPKRVVTIAWANQEVPLALGVVPVGMAKVTWGDDDGDGVLPWVEQRLTQVHAKTPTLFDETDGIDFEAVADARPDVILAAYSGLKKSDYQTLSKIAPVVAYPEHAWTTSLDDMITLDSEAIGKAAEGKALIAKLDAEVATAAKTQPDLAGTTAMFASIDPSKLSTVGFYTTGDPRAAFLNELGMKTPTAVAKASATAGSFYSQISSEDVSRLSDVDVIVTYGDAALLEKMQADPLLSRIPAVKRGAVVLLPNNTPLAASANPSPLSIGWGIDKYVDLLGAAAAKAS